MCINGSAAEGEWKTRKTYERRENIQLFTDTKASCKVSSQRFYTDKPGMLIARTLRQGPHTPNPSLPTQGKTMDSWGWGDPLYPSWGRLAGVPRLTACSAYAVTHNYYKFKFKVFITWHNHMADTYTQSPDRNGLVQDCSISSANALKIPQSCTDPLKNISPNQIWYWHTLPAHSWPWQNPSTN